MNGFSLRMARKKILSKAKPKKLLELIDNLEITPSGNMARFSPQDIRVSAVSMTVKPYQSLFDYIADMNAYIQKAREEGAQLVVFPEYAGMLILSALPVWHKFQKEVLSAGDLEEGLGRALDMMEELSEAVSEVYLTVFSELARLHDLYILSGSILTREEDRLYNRAYLFDHFGYLAATQDKIFLSALEQRMGLSCGKETVVADTEIGKLAILIGADANYFEVADIAVKKGAQILLGCDLSMGPFNPYSAQVGMEMRVQETGVFGVKSVLLGELPFDVKLYAKSGIYAPFSCTSDLSGVLAQSDSYKHDAVLTASLDLSRLEYARDIYTSDHNPALCRKNAPRGYMLLSVAPPAAPKINGPREETEDREEQEPSRRETAGVR
ncbi:nitrilase-related carbon-nitrogen hydrolase [Zongyangia hominis]|uniref:CN hydrolase domain-containing protein n=1 Tax=Zongyangia hominis TaxID=2763677 RepID=A0A926EBD8_9FIRM|nr:nitrilase-related carbon-nitrogen hydrolase [Zongyangia hominis]MBC8570688.1 hypothetical protein [Zongyangia hominis]